MTPRGRVLIATTNAGKLREIRALLGTAFEVVDLTHLSPRPEEPAETGDTFAANARLKALAYDVAARPRWPGVLTVAEDSGLEIDALGGAPGVHSARFVRPDATYGERFAEIYRRLAEVPAAPRMARFVCALAAAAGGHIVFETTGIVEGEIAEGPRGTGGFGYDPIFRYSAYGATLAEVDEDAKLRVAHRGQAFRAFRSWLERRTENGER